MDLRLKGKTAIVTGGTAGIGLAIAKAFAREGVDVTVPGRTQAKLDEAFDNSALNVRTVVADVGTKIGADALIAAVPEIDILINNLGIYEAKPFAEIPNED